VHRMPVIAWPPNDTDRNRFLGRLQVAIYVAAALYFGAFALATGAFVPWAIFTVAVAAALVAGAAMLLMRAQRQDGQRQGPGR